MVDTFVRAAFEASSKKEQGGVLTTKEFQTWGLSVCPEGSTLEAAQRAFQCNVPDAEPEGAEAAAEAGAEAAATGE